MQTVMGNFISTTSERLETIEIKPGQLIFVSDKREIYLDITAGNVAKRIPYQSILIVETDIERQALENPMEGFYYVPEDNKLWAYISMRWIEVTNKEDKEDVANKITVILPTSTDVEYPSAKAVYNLALTKEDLANKVTSVGAISTDIEYPSAKAVYTYGETKENVANKTTAIDSSSDNVHYPTAEAVYLGLNTKISQAEKQAPHGVAELDENGLVIRSQLPGFVDDVLEFPTRADFPATGESDKIYVDLSTNLTYRWSGSTYIEISQSLALGETDSTAYRGDRGAIAFAHAVTNKGSAYPNDLYKLTTNSEGHVISATAVTKADLVALGLPAQDTTYTAGTNVTIDGSNRINAVDTKYTAGPGINITAGNVIENTQTSAEWGNITGILSNQTDLQNTLTALNNKATYTAGANVSITNNVISAVDTKYIAGDNITIGQNNAISSTDTKNTTGATDIATKIYLVGASTQTATPQTYSDNEVYVTNGVLTTKAVQVGGTAATMQYNSTDKCVEFVFE